MYVSEGEGEDGRVEDDGSMIFAHVLFFGEKDSGLAQEVDLMKTFSGWRRRRLYPCSSREAGVQFLETLNAQDRTIQTFAKDERERVREHISEPRGVT